MWEANSQIDDDEGTWQVSNNGKSRVLIKPSQSWKDKNVFEVEAEPKSNVDKLKEKLVEKGVLDAQDLED